MYLCSVRLFVEVPVCMCGVRPGLYAEQFLFHVVVAMRRESFEEGLRSNAEQVSVRYTTPHVITTADRQCVSPISLLVV